MANAGDFTILGFARLWLSLELVTLSLVLPTVLWSGSALADSEPPKPDAKAPAAVSPPAATAAMPPSSEAPGIGEADEREARAQTLFRRGLALAAEERWPEAEHIFAQSFELVPRASTAFNRALALYRLGRMQEVVAMLDRFLALSDAGQNPVQQRHAVELQARASAAVATLVVHIEPSDASLDVDGLRRTEAGGTRRLLIDPGTHALVVARSGYQMETRQITLGAAEHSMLEVKLRPAPAAPRGDVFVPARSGVVPSGDTKQSRPGILPWVVVGVGGAALAASAVTGIMAFREESALDEACGSGGSCPESARDEQRRLKRWVTATDVLLISGAGVTAAGLGWLWFASKDDRSAHVSAAVSADAVHLSVGGRL